MAGHDRRWDYASRRLLQQPAGVTLGVCVTIPVVPVFWSRGRGADSTAVVTMDVCLTSNHHRGCWWWAMPYRPSAAGLAACGAPCPALFLIVSLSSLAVTMPPCRCTYGCSASVVMCVQKSDLCFISVVPWVSTCVNLCVKTARGRVLLWWLSCVVHRASCIVHRASCVVHRASCIVHRASCFVRRASCAESAIVRRA